MFWICINDDLKPFRLVGHPPSMTVIWQKYRPVPKFLCVKGILFFSFWQSIVISILVAAGAISKLGPYTDAEHISVGLTDTLICLEMPFFAFAHMFAFSHTDYIDPHRSYVARMPMYYAFRDAFGFLDVVEDTKVTLRGEGMDYREFEPAEGFMHQGTGRDRRIRAGLRYSQGGQRKYWLPRPARDTQLPGRVERGVNRAIMKVAGPDRGEEVHAPLFAQEDDDVVHLAPDLQNPDDEFDIWGMGYTDDGFELPFGDLDEDDEELFDHSKKYLFGDYNYPVVDVSSEQARTTMWDEEERVLRNERGAWFSPLRGSKGQAALERRGLAWQGYGAVDSTSRSVPRGRENAAHDIDEQRIDRLIDFEPDRVPAAEHGDVKMKWTKVQDQRSRSTSHSQSPHVHSISQLHTGTLPSHPSTQSSRSPVDRLRSPPSPSRNISKAVEPPLLPPDAVDLVVEDDHAAQEAQTRERRKGEPTFRGSGLRKVYKRGSVSRATRGATYGEIGVEEPDGDQGEAGEEISGVLGAEREDSDSIENQGNFVPVVRTEGVIARAGTPPGHARVVVGGYDEDNPWA
jgi:Organic solute transporter Ostalpha